MYATVSYSWRHCCWGTCTHHITENASKRLPACLPAAPAPIASCTGGRLFGRATPTPSPTVGPAPFQHRLCVLPGFQEGIPEGDPPT